jgi:O-antigen/teichoic acid export membrane protein
MSGSEIFGGAGKSRAPSVLRNGLYNVGGQAVRGAVSVLTIPFLIRFLGIRGYGIWSLAYAVLALVTMSEAGISVAAAVFLSKDFAEEDAAEAGRTLTFILTCAVALSTGLGVLLWFAGPQVVQLLVAFGSADRVAAGRALQIAGLAVPVFILQRVFVGVEQAFDRYGAINAFDLSQSLLANVGLVVVAWMGGRAVGLMKWQALTYLVLLLAHAFFVYRLALTKGMRLEWGSRKARQIFRYGIATWVSVLGSAAFSQGDRLIVGGILGAPLLGIYSAITSITARINSFSGTAVQPLVPCLSRDIALNVPARERIRQAVHFNALIAVEAGVFLYLLADVIMRVMVPGVTTAQDVFGLQIAALIYALYSINAPGYFILFSVGDAKTNAIVTFFSGIFSAVLIFAGARYFGLLGALAGNAGYLATLLLVTLGLRKVGIALRRYLSWVSLPLSGLAVGLLVGVVLEAHFWWRAGFVVLQGAALSFWFLRTHGGTKLATVRVGRLSEG